MLSAEKLRTKINDIHFEWTFTLAQQEFLAVTGVSGVGKSTLMNVLLGFQSALSGTLSWNGQSILQDDVYRRPFGVLFQQDNLFEHLSVYQNMALGLCSNAKLTAEQDAQLHAAAERFAISSQLKKRASSLSGGQQQRVALARVFLQNKPILLLDEPFSSLDVGLRREGLQWVKDMQKSNNTTVIMVTHHLDEVSEDVSSVLEGLTSRQWNQFSVPL